MWLTWWTVGVIVPESEQTNLNLFLMLVSPLIPSLHKVTCFTRVRWLGMVRLVVITLSLFVYL